MTAKKDFKRRVRERQEKTGESYTAARAQVLAERDDAGTAEEESGPPEREPPFSVVELIDASEDAAKLGLKCDVLVSPSVASEVAPARVLEALRDALLATEDHPEMYLLRALVFRGVRPVHDRDRLLDWWGDVRRFIQRAMVGIGGLTQTGDMLAFAVDGTMVIAQAGYVPDVPGLPHLSRGRPRLFILTTDSIQLGESRVVLPR